VTPRSERLVESLRELVATRSVSPDAGCADEVVRVAEWVAERIRRTGGTVTISSEGDCPRVPGEVRASSEPDAARDVLVDAQAAGQLDSWASPPF
jgi:acetylornithine deacetylase/succinyl-diaminopimelate desuccinylase-like protein